MKTNLSFHSEVSLDGFPEEHLNMVKAHLTKWERDYMTGESVEVNYYFVDEKRNTISIPRFYPLDYDEVIDTTEPGVSLSDGFKLNDKFQYRPGQEDAVNESLSQDILTLMKPPGSGKTIIGSCSIFKRKVRSIILVDQDTLKQQWLEALKSVFDGSIKVTDNIRLDGSKKDLDFDVYVTTIQGIIAKIRKYGLDQVRDFYQEYKIGHVLLDECHVLIGPDKFSDFGHICNSKYILALSATPRDNIYFQYWLGTTVVGDREYEVEPTIVELEFNAKMNFKSKYINWGGKFHKDRHANILFKNEDYLHLIASIAYKCYLKKRCFLIITDFNKYGVDSIYEYLLKFIPEDEMGKFVGGCDKDDVSKKYTIISNYKMMQKGADIPRLDTLFMAGELGDLTALEQTIGRLLRFNKNINKKHLIVFDTQEISMKETKWRKNKRLEFYSEKEFVII